MSVDAVPNRRTTGELVRRHRGLIGAAVVAELLALIMVSTINPHDHIDGEVYRLGAQALLAGQNIYGELPATESGLELPFIYPPFAAILFTPLTLVPKTVSTALIMLVGIGLTVVTRRNRRNVRSVQA